jgi:aryl-phospho-beta-D-glucosidase BglC (GH1 family)
MSSAAVDIAGRIKAGWNIGNTLEAIGGETAWGNPLISKAYVDFVKASGFDAVRLPAAWDQYANQTTAKIDDAWLDRIKTVIQYCVDAGLYVLLNIHWDGGWLENNVSVDKQDAVAAKQKAFWEQIATHLRDFDEHLMFASANEPNCDTAEKMEVLYRYHQTFIDAVRSTGGKNAYRVLVVQAPNTNIALAGSLWNRMPTDTASNRLMVEVHYYEPFQFTQLQEDASWGRMFYYWGKDNHSTTDPTRNADWGEEDFVDQQMAIMKSQFTDKGIPVVLGEYLASVRKNLTGDAATLNQKSVTYWMKYVTEKAVANGLLPFVWDTGGAIDRRNPAITDPVEIDTVLQATGTK